MSLLSAMGKNLRGTASLFSCNLIREIRGQFFAVAVSLRPIT